MPDSCCLVNAQHRYRLTTAPHLSLADDLVGTGCPPGGGLPPTLSSATTHRPLRMRLPGVCTTVLAIRRILIGKPPRSGVAACYVRCDVTGAEQMARLYTSIHCGTVGSKVIAIMRGHTDGSGNNYA